MTPIVALNRARDPAAIKLPRAAIAEALAEISRWPGYRPTPVAPLRALARSLGLAWLGVKLEGERFDVMSFKALGPAYALARAHRRANGALRVAVAATSGNHGRAVAWGARRLGIAARIFVPAHVGAGRAAAIAALGAEVVRVAGDFDAALGEAIAAANRPGHALIAELEGADGDAIARDILAGYGVLGLEIASLAERPSHVFVGAGAGALAAGICAGLAAGDAGAVRVVAVEPQGADAVRASLAAGDPADLGQARPSLMDGLVCATASPVAWPVLRGGLAAAIAIDDAAARAALAAASRGADGDPALAIGETGIAGLAGVRVACGDPATAAALGLDATSRVLAVACEGVTDQAVLAAVLATA